MKKNESQRKTCRVRLEPALEAFAGPLDAHERVMMAKRFFRWAIQLYVSARILRADSSPPPKPELPHLPRRKAARN